MPSSFQFRTLESGQIETPECKAIDIYKAYNFSNSVIGTHLKPASGLFVIILIELWPILRNNVPAPTTQQESAGQIRSSSRSANVDSVQPLSATEVLCATAQVFRQQLQHSSRVHWHFQGRSNVSAEELVQLDHSFIRARKSLSLRHCQEKSRVEKARASLNRLAQLG